MTQEALEQKKNAIRDILDPLLELRSDLTVARINATRCGGKMDWEKMNSAEIAMEEVYEKALDELARLT